MPEHNPVPFNEKIELAEYTPRWEEHFQEEKAKVLSVVKPSDQVVDIAHFGSTSIYGMIAKPVIGLLVGVREMPPSPDFTSKLELLDYLYFGQMGRRERHYLRKRTGQHFNIHIVRYADGVWEDNLLFSKYLNTYPHEREFYCNIKRKALEYGGGELNGYSDYKYNKMWEILGRAQLWRDCDYDHEIFMLSLKEKRSYEIKKLKMQEKNRVAINFHSLKNERELQKKINNGEVKWDEGHMEYISTLELEQEKELSQKLMDSFTKTTKKESIKNPINKD